MTTIANKETLYYISFDPGVATGWAAWDADGRLLGFGTCFGETDLFKFLYENRGKHYIFENFKLFSQNSYGGTHMGDDFPASQMIGAIKQTAFLQGAPYTEQPPNIKKIAYMQAQVQKPGTKTQEHQWDAVIHGYYYLVKHEIRKVGPLFDLSGVR